MSMTPKERVIAQIEHRETEVLPYTLSFEPGTGYEEQLDVFYGSDRWRGVLDNAIHTLPWISDGFVMEWPSDKERWTDVYGNVWRLDQRPWKLIKPALKQPSLGRYEMPATDDCFDPGWEENARREIEEYADYFTVSSFGMGLFERTWSMRGFENTMMDIVLYPDFYEELLERLTVHYLEILDRLLTLPADGFMISDDLGYQGGVTVGAERWRRFFKERTGRIYARVHEAGKYTIAHSCGSIAEIVPDLIEIGLDVYQSVQPEAKNNSPYELKRKYGDRITFWGGLGSQSTIPFGTPEEIKVEVNRLCREMGKGGGYILGPAKSFQPGTPVENAAAVLEAFLQQAGVSFP